MNQNKKQSKTPASKKRPLAAFLAGLVAGALLCAVTFLVLMPSVMIVTKESTMGFDDTVQALEKAISEQGWVVAGVRDMNKSLAEHGVRFGARVKLVELCNPAYAKSVLTTDRYVSTMMPCTFGVWQADDDRVYLSRINMKLIARMFGGNIAKVMAGQVAQDEEKILAGVLKD